MDGEKREQSGPLAKRREKQRLKRERSGDTPEKQGERDEHPEHPYSAEDMTNRASGGGIIGGIGGL